MTSQAGGNAYAWGSNKHGQLGVGSIARTKPKEDDNRLAPVQCSVSACTAVSCGAEFTMWICGDEPWARVFGVEWSGWDRGMARGGQRARAR